MREESKARAENWRVPSASVWASPLSSLPSRFPLCSFLFAHIAVFFARLLNLSFWE